MKTTRSLILPGLAAMALALVSCVKPHIPHPGNPNPGGEGGPINMCTQNGKGTVEGCPTDSTKWFINLVVQDAGCFAPMITRLVYPVNLPAAYKHTGMTVRFDYALQNDSVPFICMCATPPHIYGRKRTICSMRPDSNVVIALKPVIYLYPKKTTKVDVKLDLKGKFTVTYPDYNQQLGGWQVIANKDGHLKNLDDNTEHEYLFWEGAPTVPYNFNMKEGFCVKGSDTRDFLQTTLPKLGLTAKEYNDMIVYWLPRMMNNPYNLIRFADEDYTQSAPLTVLPKPDHMIRVFMAFQPSETFVKTNEPVINTPKRDGFTVVEWGGAELDKDYRYRTPLF